MRASYCVLLKPLPVQHSPHRKGRVSVERINIRSKSIIESRTFDCIRVDVGKWIGDIFSVEAMYLDLFVECLKEDKRNMRMRCMFA